MATEIVQASEDSIVIIRGCVEQTSLEAIFLQSTDNSARYSSSQNYIYMVPGWSEMGRASKALL